MLRGTEGRIRAGLVNLPIGVERLRSAVGPTVIEQGLGIGITPTPIVGALPIGGVIILVAFVPSVIWIVAALEGRSAVEGVLLVVVVIGRGIVVAVVPLAAVRVLLAGELVGGAVVLVLQRVVDVAGVVTVL